MRRLVRIRDPGVLLAIYIVALPAVAAVALYLWLFADSLRRNWTHRHLIDLLYLWQTQTGAALGVAAAVTGALVVLDQTKDTCRREEARRTRRAEALRAVLPLTLAELDDYAMRCIRQLDQARITATNVKDPALRIVALPLPVGLAAALADLIESSESGEAAPLVALLRDVQIQHSRMARLAEAASSARLSSPTPRDLAGGIDDAARIYAQCEALIPFARGRGGPPGPVTADESRMAVLIALRDVPEEVERVIAEREQARVQPTGERPIGWLSRLSLRPRTPS